ncbi:hypothetical protein B4Q13_24620, partial [Lacticaseibacillus rhamnosus]
KAGRVELSSGAGYHWAHANLFVTNHPYFAFTDLDGRFAFDQVPAGAVKVVAWHPNWWMAKQAWSNGRVGLLGTNYGGYVAWAATKRMPPALKAIDETGDRLAREALRELIEQGVGQADLRIEVTAHIRYAGTDTALEVPAWTMSGWYFSSGNEEAFDRAFLLSHHLEREFAR